MVTSDEPYRAADLQEENIRLRAEIELLKSPPAAAGLLAFGSNCPKCKTESKPWKDREYQIARTGWFYRPARTRAWCSSCNYAWFEHAVLLPRMEYCPKCSCSTKRTYQPSRSLFFGLIGNPERMVATCNGCDLNWLEAPADLVMCSLPKKKNPCKHVSVRPEFEYKSLDILNMTATKIRLRWPRFEGHCPECSEEVVAYASEEHRVLGEWPVDEL